MGSDMFVYTSAYSGSIAAENALTDSNKIYDTEILPRVISNVPIAIASKESHVLVKIVAEKGTDRLLVRNAFQSESLSLHQA